MTLHQRDRVDGKILLQRCQSIELGEHRLGIEATLDTNDQPQTVVAVGEVCHITDAGQFLTSDGVLDLVDYALRSDQIGQLRHNKSCFARPNVFDTDGGPGLETSSTGEVSIGNALGANDGSAAGQIGAGNNFL